MLGVWAAGRFFRFGPEHLLTLGRRPQPPRPGDEQGAAPGRGMRVCVCGKVFERQACFLGPGHQGCRGAGGQPPFEDWHQGMLRPQQGAEC